jgi:hypothetical protein
MATVLELATRQPPALLKLDPALEAREQEWRMIYILPRVRPRIETELRTWRSNWQVEQSPLQQMDSLLEVFCSGETLTFDQRFKPLVHLNDGIWELKTPDLRFFGWFPHKDCFIGGALDLAFNVKSYNLYPGYADEVAYHRTQLDLDNPKFIPGADPRDVVTNYDYP